MSIREFFGLQPKDTGRKLSGHHKADQPYLLIVQIDDGEYGMNTFHIPFHYDFYGNYVSGRERPISIAEWLAKEEADRIRRTGLVDKDDLYSDEIHYPAHRVRNVRVVKDLHEPEG